MISLNDIFNKIYVISLLSEEKRRENILYLSKTFQFNFEFINAVDHKDLNIQNFINEKKLAYLKNDFFCKNYCTCKGLGHDIDIKQIACSLSHYKTWSKCIENNHKKILILEDDVYLDNDFGRRFDIFSKNLPNKWNYINLGRNNKIKNSRKSIQKIKRGFSGTQMYGLSNYGLKQAYANFFPIRAHIDGYLDYFVIQNRKGSVGLKYCYASTENFGKNGSIDGKFETTIQNYFE